MRHEAIQTKRGWARRCAVLTAGALALAASLRLDPATAEPISSAGTISVVVPATPEYVRFSLTVNEQTYDNSTVDNSFGGTLTVGWSGSEQEPQATVLDCAGGGKQIELSAASPGASIWATFVSPSQQSVVGPFEVPPKEGFVIGSVCVDDESGNASAGGDPDPGSQGTPPRPEEEEDDEDDDDDDDSNQGENDDSGSGGGSNESKDKKGKDKKGKDGKGGGD